MMDSTKLRELFYQELLDKTSAGDQVFKARDWPTHIELFPALLISTPYEKKRSLGRNAPQFDTVTKVQVEGRVNAFDEGGSTVSGAEKALLAAEQFRDDVFVRIINNPAIYQHIQQFVSVESETSTSSEGEGHVGQFVIHFDVEYYQGPEDFYPLMADPVYEMEIKKTTPEGTEPTGVIIEFER